MTYSGDGVTVIHTGVNAYGLNLYDAGVAVQGAGVADGTYNNGAISTAYRPDYRVVYLNGTGSVSFGPNGQWGLLTANACAAQFVQP